jgi:exosome complex component RRP41
MNKITLLQLNGRLTRSELQEGLQLARKGIDDLYTMQKQALRSKFLDAESSVEEE